MSKYISEDYEKRLIELFTAENIYDQKAEDFKDYSERLRCAAGELDTTVNQPAHVWPDSRYILNVYNIIRYLLSNSRLLLEDGLKPFLVAAPLAKDPELLPLLSYPGRTSPSDLPDMAIVDTATASAAASLIHETFEHMDQVLDNTIKLSRVTYVGGCRPSPYTLRNMHHQCRVEFARWLGACILVQDEEAILYLKAYRGISPFPEPGNARFVIGHEGLRAVQEARRYRESFKKWYGSLEVAENTVNVPSKHRVQQELSEAAKLKADVDQAIDLNTAHKLIISLQEELHLWEDDVSS